jgi:hypothetical protein
VRVWDITNMNQEPIFEKRLYKGMPVLNRLCSHRDAIGSVQLHPFRPLLLNVTGSRKSLHNSSNTVWEDSDSDHSSSDEDDSSSASDIDSDKETTLIDTRSRSLQTSTIPLANAESAMRILAFT